MDFIIMMVALFAIMYFLMIRPQQKRARKDQEMRSQLAPGDRVLLTSGLFATITHAGDKQFIVELAPDVQITVLKGSVARKVLPEDEEFEPPDPPLPRWDPLLWCAVAGIVLGPVLLITLVLFQPYGSKLPMWLAAGMTAGGLGVLLARLPGGHDDDDDGARV